MTRLVVVRHGEAAAGFGDAADPGLSPKGLAQAEGLAGRLAELGRRPVFSSPMRRARETAEPLAERYGVSVAVAPVLREVPSPTADLAERRTWLRGALAGGWSDLSDEVAEWRDAILEAAAGVRFPQVWVSHFVVMNALVASTLGREEVTVFRPDHCAIVELDIIDGVVSIAHLPGDADSLIR
jgi:broad specificity phosphatase PhoE